MKIVDLYSSFLKSLRDSSQKVSLHHALNENPELKHLEAMALEWELDLANTEKWIKSREYDRHALTAEKFIAGVHRTLDDIQRVFKTELPGEVHLVPSLMRFDGFARYDLGKHVVWFGVDHPDADENYLRALMAHELSHVYRDHRPDVWKHLGKPLSKVTRAEYLDAVDAYEHLASEGLATLFSQVVYPEIPLHIHHYYFQHEMQWCFDHAAAIDQALKKCLASKEQNVWKFYEEDAVENGSPSRTQYFWAARQILEWLEKINDKDKREKIIEAHGWSSDRFECFK